MSEANACLLPENLQDQLWIIVNLEDLSFAISAHDVKDMIAMPALTRLPEGSAETPGTISHRGAVVPLVDFRAMLGRSTIQDDVKSFCAMMDQREQDHRNWLATLETSVRERTPFTLATDPHQCAFGKWYDSYETDDLVLQGLLRKFDAPHQAVHAIAVQVKAYEEREEYEAAFALIETTRARELKTMVDLFEDVRQAVREQGRRQVALVLEKDEKQVALAVDSVDSVEELAADAIAASEQVFPPQWSSWVHAIGRRKKAESLTLIVHSEVFFNLAARLKQ